MTADMQPATRRGLANFYDADADADTIGAGLDDYRTVPVPRGFLQLVARILVEDDVPKGHSERAAQMIQSFLQQGPPAERAHP
ncbi:hypothetical protein ACFQ6V_05795 [Streptomyces roseifaciens]